MKYPKDDIEKASLLIENYCQPLEGVDSDYNDLIARIGEARVVMLGQSTYGTEEFYRERARITRRLINEKGFNAIAFEQDWPDIHRLNRYVRGAGSDQTATEALAGLDHFPSRLLHNQETVSLIEELARTNRLRGSENKQVALYGLDNYGFYRAVDDIVAYLDNLNQYSASFAREQFSLACALGDKMSNQQTALTGLIKAEDREAMIASLLQQRSELTAVSLDGFAFSDSKFLTEEMPESIAAAEEFYHTLLNDPARAQSRREEEMAARLDAILDHLDNYLDEPGRVVVWAHNRRIADARSNGYLGETSLGQMVRQSYGQQSFLVGMTTYQGQLTAASGWGLESQVQELAPARPGSLEDFFHRVNCQNFLIIPTPGNESYDELNRRFKHREVGAVYLPKHEEDSHYLLANPAISYDAVVHIDQSEALREIDDTPT